MQHSSHLAKLGGPDNFKGIWDMTISHCNHFWISFISSFSDSTKFPDKRFGTAPESGRAWNMEPCGDKVSTFRHLGKSETGKANIFESFWFPKSLFSSSWPFLASLQSSCLKDRPGEADRNSLHSYYIGRTLFRCFSTFCVFEWCFVLFFSLALLGPFDFRARKEMGWLWFHLAFIFC